MRAPRRASVPSLLRPRPVLPPIVLLGVASIASIAPLACGARGDDDAVRVAVGPSLLFPRGLLDAVTTVDLTVYDASAGVDCDPPSGATTGVTDATPRVANAPLAATGSCAAGARFCGSLSISKSDAPRVFSATARAQGGDTIALGCAIATVNQDTLSVPIKMVRFVPTAVCGDGKLGATEQCEPPGGANDAVCDAQCHTKEETLSNGVAAPTGPASFLWPAQAGDAGRFFAFFTSKGTSDDVAMRVMSDALAPLASPPGLQSALLMPTDPNGTFPPAPAPNNQSQPTAATTGSLTWVAFTDDENGDPDVHLRSFDASVTAQQGAGAAIGINGPNGGGEPNKQTTPAIALGPAGKLFVAWQDETGPFAGQVMGRVFDTNAGTLGTQNQISTGSQNKHVRLAATATGWVAVWESGPDVKLRVIDGNGTPSGPEQTVNDAAVHHGTQDHPGVAVLADGRLCVVWADHGATNGADVFAQRFDRDLTRVAGDQALPINDAVAAGDQIDPAVAGVAAAGGAFVAAWVDAPSGHVRARFLGGSGSFLFNNVDGQGGEFQASLAGGHTRANPAVAAGGIGTVAIGWDDTTSGDAIVVRRFPQPTP